MPTVDWEARIPEILDELATRDQNEVLGRRQVEELLLLKTRQSQRIMTVAGADKVGAHRVLLVSDLVRYLEAHGGTAMAEERARRIRFARKLDAMRTEFMETPRVMVDIEPIRPIVRLVEQKGMAELPEGITFAPGLLTIRYRSLLDLQEKLFVLAKAMGKDYDRLEEMLGLAALEGRVS